MVTKIAYVHYSVNRQVCGLYCTYSGTHISGGGWVDLDVGERFLRNWPKYKLI